jgi:hypothetical protein
MLFVKISEKILTSIFSLFWNPNVEWTYDWTTSRNSLSDKIGQIIFLAPFFFNYSYK